MGSADKQREAALNSATDGSATVRYGRFASMGVVVPHIERSAEQWSRGVGPGPRSALTRVLPAPTLLITTRHRSQRATTVSTRGRDPISSHILEQDGAVASAIGLGWGAGGFCQPGNSLARQAPPPPRRPPPKWMLIFWRTYSLDTAHDSVRRAMCRCFGILARCLTCEP